MVSQEEDDTAHSGLIELTAGTAACFLCPVSPTSGGSFKTTSSDVKFLASKQVNATCYAGTQPIKLNGLLFCMYIIMFLDVSQTAVMLLSQNELALIFPGCPSLFH